MANSSEAVETPAWWRAPLSFAVEAIVGTFIFSTIATSAVFLDFAVEALAHKEVSPAILGGLQFAEYCLFFVDLTLFVRFLWKTASRSWSNF